MEYVESMGHEVTNFGTDSSESCNYPEYGEKVANAVVSGEFDCGILICGTGVGISIAANKVNGIRAAVLLRHSHSTPCKTAQQCQYHSLW